MLLRRGGRQRDAMIEPANLDRQVLTHAGAGTRRRFTTTTGFDTGHSAVLQN